MNWYNSTVMRMERESGHAEQRRQFTYAIGVWELVICCIGTPANALVLYLAITIIRKGGRGSSGKQHWFVASMTTADLMFTSLHSPMFFSLYTLGTAFSGFSCSLFYLFTHVSIVASSLSLLLLNIDKFLALHKPLHYPTLMTPGRAWILLSISWSVSIAWALFLVFGPFLTVKSNCGPEFKPEYRVMYYAFATVFFALPVCVSVFIAVFVTAVARKSRSWKMVKQHDSNTANDSVRSSSLRTELTRASDGFNGIDRRNRQSERMAHIKAITFVFTTTLWSAVTLLPYRFTFVLSLLGYPSNTAQSIFLTMTTMNALGNPFITISTQYQYRKGLRRLWRRVLRRQTLADNEFLAQQMAATIRMMCQQQELLITAASRRAKLRPVSPSPAREDLLSPSTSEMHSSPDNSFRL